MFQTAWQYSADEPDYGFSAVVLRYAIRTDFDWQPGIVKRGYLFKRAMDVKKCEEYNSLSLSGE